MAQTCDLLLTSGTLVNQDGEAQRDIAVSGGRIVAIGDLRQWSAAKAIDCRGLHILPGVMDTQVHFREPGLTHKEDLETGSRGAVMGGVTGVFEMPNTNPLTIDAATFADKIKRAHHRMHCDFAFYIGGTRENVADLPELERAPGCAGVKVFIGSSTGSLLVEDDEGLRKILKVDPPPGGLPRRGRISPEGAHASARGGRSVLASGVARRGSGDDRDAAAGHDRA